ncbi:MAG: hypothetical protein QXS54_09600 [Candidatus Methanomethylicaceae archaeon]
MTTRESRSVERRNGRDPSGSPEEASAPQGGSDQEYTEPSFSRQKRTVPRSPLYDLEYSYYTELNNEEKFVVVKKRGVPFEIVDDAIYDLMDRASKGLLVVRHISVYREGIDLF